MKVSAFSPTQTTSASGTSGSSHLMAVTSSDDNTPDRRAFMKRSVGIFSSGMATGGYVNFESHAPNCNCDNCLGNDDHDHAEGCACGDCGSGKEHSLGCQCSNCFRFGPLSAVAYERDVGDDSRSPESYAQNLQAKKTNARLEKSGFKLDTKEEESARLNEAFASFSYDSVSTGGKKSVGKGYGNKSNNVKSK